MRVLNPHAYYYPERIASSRVDADLEQGFVEQSYDVIVITPIPTRGCSVEERIKYKKKKKEIKNNGHVKVYRFALFKEGSNIIIRFFRYSIGFFITLILSIVQKDIDAVFADSTPPIQGLMCAIIKSIKKVPFIYSLQDIFPDSLVGTKITKKGSWIWKIGQKMEDKIYRSADEIIVLSDAFKNNLLMKGVPKEKVFVIPTWVDNNCVYPLYKKDNGLFSELNLDESIFYVVYAGNMGFAQNMDVVVNSAIQCLEDSSIQFIVFGNGTEKQRIKERIAEEKISNILVLPMQPLERVSEVYGIGDVCLITCKAGFGKCAFPSKTYSIMATARPIIASFDLNSDLCELIKKAECGMSVAADDPTDLAKAIKVLKNKGIDYCNKLGKNGKRYLDNNFSRINYVKRTIDIIETACKKE